MSEATSPYVTKSPKLRAERISRTSFPYPRIKKGSFNLRLQVSVQTRSFPVCLFLTVNTDNHGEKNRWAVSGICWDRNMPEKHLHTNKPTAIQRRTVGALSAADPLHPGRLHSHEEAVSFTLYGHLDFSSALDEKNLCLYWADISLKCCSP